MAIWQYTFEMIPQKKMLNLNFTSKISRREYDKLNIWLGEDRPEIFFNFITQNLPYHKNWNENIRQYGSEDSTCIKLYFEKGFVTEVTIRFDYRTDYLLVLKQIIKFCLLNDLCLIDENLNIVPINLVNIISIIENSQQYKTFYQLK